MAELVLGDSLGMCIAALISGSHFYWFLDEVEHASTEKILETFAELASLFEGRQDVANDTNHSSVQPALTAYKFLEHILDEMRMIKVLDPERLKHIRKSITDPSTPGSLIAYKVPWTYTRIASEDHLDMIFSLAALERTNHITTPYRDMTESLKPKDTFHTR